MSITNEQSNRPDNGVYISHAILKARVKELEAENTRLRAAVEAAGGLCECGHTKDTHTYDEWSPEGSDFHDCYVKDCGCYRFRPATQPGEGER